MIFVALGTSPSPFASIVSPLVSLSREYDILCQSGSTKFPPSIHSIPFLDHSQIQSYILNADLVVTHGGVGLISDCLSLGVKPVVVPRDGVADGANHSQRDFADLLALYGCLDLVANPLYLPSFISHRLRTQTTCDHSIDTDACSRFLSSDSDICSLISPYLPKI